MLKNKDETTYLPGQLLKGKKNMTCIFQKTGTIFAGSKTIVTGKIYLYGSFTMPVFMFTCDISLFTLPHKKTI